MTRDTYLNPIIADAVLRVYIVLTGYGLVFLAGMARGVLESMP